MNIIRTRLHMGYLVDKKNESGCNRKEILGSPSLQQKLTPQFCCSEGERLEHWKTDQCTQKDVGKFLNFALC
jgi:hypothetical protein